MSKIFDDLMSKPHHARRRMAFAITGVAGVAIMASWFFVQGNAIKQAIKPSDEAIKEAQRYQEELKEKTYQTKIINEQQLQKMRGLKPTASPSLSPEPTQFPLR